MKKLVRRSLTLLSTFILCMAMSITAFAGYDPDTDPRNDIGDYLVDNYTDRGSTVLLYVYAETGDNTVITEEHGLEFMYYGEEEDSHLTPNPNGCPGICFMYRPQNAEVYATLDMGEVWVYQFSIENGLYLFSGHEVLTNKYVLDSNAPLEDKLRYVENETIQLYTMCGGWSTNKYGHDFGSEENMTMFYEWAKENDKKLAERTAPQPIVEETTVEAITEEVTIEEISTETETEEVVEVVEEKEEVKPTPVEEPEEESGSILPFVIGGACFVLLTVIGILCTKRK